MNQVFLGEFIHSFDSQRRITIPSEWRGSKNRKTSFYLLPGRRKTIQMLPAASFEEVLSKIRKVSFADAEASLALARIGRMAQSCQCDAQGRIQISPNLYSYAELSGNAVLVGAINVIQIWSEKNWAKFGGTDEQVLDVIQKINERPEDITEILKGKI